MDEAEAGDALGFIVSTLVSDYGALKLKALIDWPKGYEIPIMDEIEEVM